jgi:hypothetical protein
MSTCTHCGEPIMEFSFTEGKTWWHVDGATTYLHCRSSVSDKVAAPRPDGKQQ